MNIIIIHQFIEWLGVIFVREGYYKGGIFKFNVIFSEYPFHILIKYKYLDIILYKLKNLGYL